MGAISRTMSQWVSLESDLKIEARHEYGHVQLLHVTVSQFRADWGNHGWRACADTLEPGEKLSRVAYELSHLVEFDS